MVTALLTYWLERNEFNALFLEKQEFGKEKREK